MTQNPQIPCPVCGFASFSVQQPCPQCGWEYPVLLGDEASARDYTQQQLAQARADWQARRYNPALVPELQRDPFETWEEFAERLAARPWYVGEATLQKDGYDIDTGQFPLRIDQPRDWARAWLNDFVGLHLQLPRDPARALYQQSPTWPVYLWLAVENRQPQNRELVLVGPEGELTIQPSQSQCNAPTAPTSPQSGKRIGYEQRYLDPGDGTVIDTVTGLQWMRCALGQAWRNGTCAGSASSYTWKQALKAPQDFNTQGGFAGHRDWRVPTIEELKTLILCTSGQPKTWNDTGKQCKGDYQQPTICQEAFSSTPSARFWSASPGANSSNYAGGVNFFDGGVNGYGTKYSSNAVRLVRGGQ